MLAVLVDVIGKVQLVARSQSRPVVRVTADGGRVDDSRPHTVILRADSTHGTLQLDDGRQRSFTIASHASPAVGAMTSSIHLGSLVDSTAAAVARRYLLRTGFVGCIQVSYQRRLKH